MCHCKITSSSNREHDCQMFIVFFPQSFLYKAEYPLWFLSGAVFIRFENVWPLVRIYRGGFLLIQFIFLLGINTYGWRQAGVNHVLIFEINPRNNLSHQHLFEVRVKTIISVSKWEPWVFWKQTPLQLIDCSIDLSDHAFLKYALRLNGDV